MDNKENRKFYSEVKNFMHSPSKIKMPKSDNDLENAVKSILEQNKIYKQTNFSPNSTSMDAVSQVISNTEQSKKKFTPQSNNFAKTDPTNPFSQLDENSMARYARSLASGAMRFLSRPDAAIKAGAASTKQGAIYMGKGMQNWVKQNPITAITLGGLGTLGVAYGGYKYATSGNEAEAEVETEPTEGEETKPETEVEKPLSFEDKLEKYKDASAKGTDIPVYRPASRSGGSNFQEWQKATKARNAALRAANKELNKEQENIRGQMAGTMDQMKAIRDTYGLYDKEGKLIRITNDAAQAEYDRLAGEKTALSTKGRKISDLRSNEGLANTLSQQSDSRRRRWEGKLSEFEKQQGVAYNIKDPEHQRVMRGIMGFPVNPRDPAGWAPPKSVSTTGTDSKPTTTTSMTPASTGTTTRSNIPGVDLSPDTPDWVRRHAEKFGENSAREIEAMRLGVTSVLQGDPTRPMDTALSASEVARRGQLLDRDRRAFQNQNRMTTSGRQTGIGTGKTASQPESTWDEVARKSVQGDSELASAPLVRRNGKVYAQTANGEIELSTGSMNTSHYADNAPTREQMNKGKK